MKLCHGLALAALLLSPAVANAGVPAGRSPVGWSTATGTCDKDQAVANARAVSDAIVRVNGQDWAHGRTDEPVGEDANYFYVTTSYDQGLSVPTYTVKVLKYGCSVLDVTYGNREG